MGDNKPGGSHRAGLYPVLILLEDNRDDFLLLKRALWKVGATARVWWAHDSFEALDILARIESPALSVSVIADVQLPELNGFELLAQLRSKPEYGRVRFGFLTGCHDKRTEERAYACGADAFLVKPARSEDWIEVARALQRLASAPMIRI